MPKKNQNRIVEQELPAIKGGVCVCQVGVARGGSQFEVWDGESTWLAELPKRFRNTIWVRRGGFVLVNTSNGSNNASGIRGEIVFMLLKDHVSQLKKQGDWPSKLEETQETGAVLDTKLDELPGEEPSHDVGTSNDTDESSDSELFQNNNRR